MHSTYTRQSQIERYVLIVISMFYASHKVRLFHRVFQDSYTVPKSKSNANHNIHTSTSLSSSCLAIVYLWIYIMFADFEAFKIFISWQWHDIDEKISEKKYFLISISYIDADSVVLGSNWCSFECWRILFLRSSIFVAHFSSKCQEVSNDSLWWHIDTFIGCALTQNCGNDRRERKAYNIFQIQIDPLLSFTRYVVHPSGSYSKESMFLCEPRGGKKPYQSLATFNCLNMWNVITFFHPLLGEREEKRTAFKQTNKRINHLFWL